MRSTSQQRLFPLHLSPIEKFLRADDRPGYPMTFVVQLDFSGRMDRPAFEAALEEALTRHPLLLALVRPAKGKLDCWVASNGLRPAVDWGGDDVPVTCPDGTSIDLEREVGLRIWIRQGADRVRLFAQFHHVCCDGIGGYRFLGDLLALYGGRMTAGEQRPTLHPVQLARLKARAHGCMELARSGQPGRLARRALSQGLQIMGRGCTPLHPSKSNEGPQAAAPFHGILSLTFERAEHQRLRNAAGRLGAMLNDLLLHELFCTMHAWNTARRPRSPGRRFRIMMPVDLRDVDDYETPAANIIGYTFLTRRASELRDPRRSLAGIRRETARIKHHRLGRRFVDTVAAASGFRGLLPWILAAPRTLATAVFSNVGDPSRRFTARFPRRGGRVVFGNLTLEAISGVPPMRPRTRATFSILSYNRTLTVNLRCDPHRFSVDATQELFSLYIDRLRRHVDGAPAVP